MGYARAFIQGGLLIGIPVNRVKSEREEMSSEASSRKKSIAHNLQTTAQSMTTAHERIETGEDIENFPSFTVAQEIG
jgi:hypothetical protein